MPETLPKTSLGKNTMSLQKLFLPMANFSLPSIYPLLSSFSHIFPQKINLKLEAEKTPPASILLSAPNITLSASTYPLLELGKFTLHLKLSCLIFAVKIPIFYFNYTIYFDLLIFCCQNVATKSLYHTQLI